VLTVDLFGGGSVSGLVTDGTEVKCDNGDDQGDEDGDAKNGEDGDNQDEGDDNHACSVDNLVPGAVVQEADLELEHGQAVFEEIELAQ